MFLLQETGNMELSPLLGLLQHLESRPFRAQFLALEVQAPYGGEEPVAKD